jgi:hypothetical protein
MDPLGAASGSGKATTAIHFNVFILNLPSVKAPMNCRGAIGFRRSGNTRARMQFFILLQGPDAT